MTDMGSLYAHYQAQGMKRGVGPLSSRPPQRLTPHTGSGRA